ncbi:MAG: UDP-N-acetylglucosamine 1-carboxyvinyltransferase [Limnochordia bacterium]|jgi:UDP-N-acetylglucosamine 1-carboxyvinyltransferase|nr:UDP-N-acetylglucosamine 1-carboxyvinyltransferase [Bacillota bacterium]HOB09359.1 UDP-N-acetylglucosamine 1-carboxyvinyltransferase [Limnochordia bacterium]NLH31389.1 UDP-N-acetylglucosamine 1-carboxyvinyltransferase [Bacillota bacterium]HPT93360.1 UDP-N-acetylglucosamine 1-carboxyvinyltransferase [Limnochordia bacterium]HPZ30455.1 UDP-N-acetylglucosamine 1-carboxyvinyltransferase [Limnochordia bacterium]
MAKLVIQGGNRLQGEVRISGAKNSALPIIVAAALAVEGECVLDNIPKNNDVGTICLILRSLGVDVWFDEDDKLHVVGATLREHQAPYDLVRKMRASFYTAGLLLARLGRAEVPLPGGCAIGSRPVDFHIRGFSQMGADIAIEHGFMKAKCRKLTGTNYYINRSSVGTTMNMMMAASLAEGTTILENCAKEPEVVDLAIFLNGMGAQIRGAGTDVIRVDGVEKLHGIEYSIIPDRIEAGTFMFAAAITGGDVLIKDIVIEHLRSPISKIEEAGVTVEKGATEIRVIAPEKLQSIDVETAPYPGFPTDLQQPLVACMSVADGTSVIRENIFDRFRYVDELRRMGADIKVERETAIIRGVPQLTGAPVEVTDLRAGAALVIAALKAAGTTEVYGVDDIDRGYERFEDKLRGLGASVQRVETHEGIDAFAQIRS